MANRFTQYQNVDYVGLPVEAYQMVAGVKEAEAQARLDAMKNSYDYMKSIETAANPDSELKQSILSNISEKMSELAKRNLKGSDTLLELNKVINNPDHINRLSEIYGNTQNIKAKNEADIKYADEFGNDINTRESSDQFAQYNKLGKEGFKAGIFKGYTPGKFVDITGEINDRLAKMKDDGWTETSTGMWITKNMKEGVTLERALAASGMQLNDPKYASQLKKIGYYGLSNMGIGEGGIQGTLKRYNTGMAANTSDAIAQYTKVIAELKEKQAKHPKKDYYAKAIEEGIEKVKDLTERREAYMNDEGGAMYQSDLLNNMAKTASAGIPHMKNTTDIAANPFELARLRSSLDLAAWKKKHDIVRAEELEDRKHLESLYEPSPTSRPAVIDPATGALGNAVMINQQGGYDSKRLMETALDLVNTYDITTPDGKVDAKGTAAVRLQLAKEIKEGSVTMSYIPELGKWQITSPTRTLNVVADKLTQQQTANLKEIAGFRKKGEQSTILQTSISLDGKRMYPALFARTFDEKNENPQVSVFTPTRDAKGQPISYTREDVRKNPALLGDPAFKASHADQFVTDGIYVVSKSDLQLWNSTGIAGTQEQRRVMPINEYRNKIGKLETDPTKTGVKYYHYKGNVLTELDPNQISESDINTNQIKLLSNKGGAFANLTEDRQAKSTSIYNSTKKSYEFSNSQSESQ